MKTKVFSLGVNGKSLSDSQMRGFARHTFELLKAMRVIHPSMKITLFSDRPIAEVYLQELGHANLVVSKVRPSLVWEQVVLPGLIRKAAVDIFHATANSGLPAFVPGGIPRVLTLHDMIAIRGVRASAKAAFPRKLKGALSFFASQRAALSANSIITVSDYSKNQILKDYPWLHDRVHVIHNGVQPRFKPGPPDSHVLEKFGLNGKYILYVGGFDERKNVSIFSDVLSILPASVRETFTLALGGDASIAPKTLRVKLASFPNVKWLGYVPDGALLAIYQGATCVVLPSRDEGFGLQVLEAMGCGVPVLLSNASSFPEVGGEAATYFQPDDADELAQLIQKALTDSQWLEKKRAAGLARASTFSWKLAAQKTLDLYSGLLNKEIL